MREDDFPDISFSEDYYDYNFNDRYIIGEIKFIERKEREEKNENIHKDSGYFKQNQINEELDNDRYYMTSKKSKQENVKEIFMVQKIKKEQIKKRVEEIQKNPLCLNQNIIKIVLIICEKK